MHRPIGKWPAIAICSAFAFLNIMIFIALSSENKTHTVVFVMGVVSYWILRKEHFIFDKKNLNDIAERYDAAEHKAQLQHDVESTNAEIKQNDEVPPTSNEVRKTPKPEKKVAWHSTVRLNYRKGLLRIWALGSIGFASWFLLAAYDQHQDLKPLNAAIEIAEQRNADPKEHAKVAEKNAPILKRMYSKKHPKLEPLLRTPLEVLDGLKNQKKRIEAERNEQVQIAIGAPVIFLIVAIILRFMLSWVAAGFRQQRK